MNIKRVKNSNEGIHLAKTILYDLCDKKTALFLSGGKTPKPLYEALAKEEKLTVGAVAMVDDRYSLHEQYSNEFMIRESGLIPFLEKENIPFYPILKYGLNRIQTAREYESDVKFLFEHFKKKIAILGIGRDGHTAGILPMYNRLVHYTPHKNSLVSASEYSVGQIRERITLTFKALSEMDYLIVLVTGSEKKKALELMLKKGPIEQVPARFLVQVASKKTILITDQPVSPLAHRGGKL